MARTNRHTSGKHTFNTVKGWCTPARAYIEKAFGPLGINASYGANVLEYEGKTPDKMWHAPTSQSQTVTVNRSQAVWAAYVLGSLVNQVNMKVEGGLDRGPILKSYRKGNTRNGVPMPWVYAMDDREERHEGIVGCVKTLGKRERDAALANPTVKAAVTKGTPLSGKTIRFTSEKRREAGSTRRSRVKTGKGTTKRSKPRGGRPTASKRGSHRGAHRR